MTPLTSINTSSHVQSVEITQGWLPWIVVLGSIGVIFLLIWKILLPFLHNSLNIIMDRNDKNIKLLLTSFEKALETLEKRKSILVILFLIGLSGCQMTEKVTFHFGDDAQFSTEDLNNIVIKEPELVFENIRPIEPEIVTIKTYRGSKKRVNLQIIRRLQKQCEPACHGMTYCNDTTGKCEALAGSYKWTPEDEHSRMLLANSIQIGTFSSGDEYLMRNR